MRTGRRLVAVFVAVALLGFLASCTHDTSTAAPPQRGPAQNAVRPSPLPSLPVPSYVSGLGSGWALTFDAGFTGSRLDTSVWATCYPWESEDGCTNFGNPDEREWYVPSQDEVYGGALHLEAQRTSTAGLASNGSPKEYDYRSGMVTTFLSYQFQYGYVQVVARIPYATGLWPALWLAASNERWPPEVDIVEHYGTQAQYYQHLHSVNYPVQEAAESTENLSAGWHVFGLYWSPNSVTWFVDGHQVMSTKQGVPQQSMYFIANLAVYQQVAADWTQQSADMEIQSVKVWQGKSYPAAGRQVSASG